MPTLSWNEIKHRAVEFSKEWEDETSEKAEAQSFWNDFFYVFGIRRQRFAYFEKQVRKIDGRVGYIDLFWPKVILVEHKSKGQNLDTAYGQAIDYFPGLDDNELPKYILVSDFGRFRLYNMLEENVSENFVEFELKDLVNNVHLFSEIAGYQKREYKEEDPVNTAAAQLMGKLHDKLKEVGYISPHLDVYIIRMLFCMFADDTGIFEKDIFLQFIESKTSYDGSDLADKLSHLFQVLNTPEDNRLTNLDETLNSFSYINGKLFEEVLPIASFDREMREILLECSRLDWSQISPAIFGSLFQSVMDPDTRRNLGAHYTSEKNILKLIKPLFLDALWEKFDKVKNNSRKLKAFHDELANLKFLDPACGCGNFLIITYRELRLLEIKILKKLLIDPQGSAQQIFNLNKFCRVDVDSFYGIELEEFPSRIAEVAMWMIDHQMNMKVSEAFGEYFTRLPLKKSANIIHDNSLIIDWESVIQPTKLSYILGNPPFAGKHLQAVEQKNDMAIVFKKIKGFKNLDYVTAWYIKAARYIQGSKIKVAFVSTNSISQGEQVGILWNELLKNYNIKIHFAHRTFKWNNEAKGQAGVYVVIIGFACFDTNKKFLYEYDNAKSEAHEVKVKNINPYLVEGDDIVILKRYKPISDFPPMTFGSKPVDDGNLILNDKEKEELIKKEPKSKEFIRPLISAKTYLNNVNRWVLWLADITPSDLRNMPEIYRRIEKVKEFRFKSKKKQTLEAANYPTLFAELRQPDTDYIVVPIHSSEKRQYVPLDYFSKEFIVNNSVSYVSDANLYHFGVLSSIMHMTWMRYTAGRLESRYRYSGSIVYNNFPWPYKPTQKQIRMVKLKAEKILKVRDEYRDSSLADLYDPTSMPTKLVKAHKELDKAVDSCYGRKKFSNESNRLKFLFELYEKYNLN